MKPAAVCLMGPTASGKTDLALELARHVPLEIISVDSAMVYRGMDIGTAKPDAAIRAEVPHHLIDVRDPIDAYSAAMFRADAIRLVDEIRSRDRLPLLTGGTMLYFRALKEGFADLPGADVETRRRIQAWADAEGWPSIHRRLAGVDPESAARLNPNDASRLQRALEVFELTGQPLSDLHRDGSAGCPFPLLEIAIVPQDRAALHAAIAGRFRAMLEAGFIEEVKALKARGDLHADLPAIKAVGYRQVWAWLEGEFNYDTMVDRGIIATRQLAKRQFTWLRSWQDLERLEAPEIRSALKLLASASIL